MIKNRGLYSVRAAKSSNLYSDKSSHRSKPNTPDLLAQSKKIAASNESREKLALGIRPQGSYRDIFFNSRRWINAIQICFLKLYTDLSLFKLKTKLLLKIESSPGMNRIENLLSHHILGRVSWQPQGIHTSLSSGEHIVFSHAHLTYSKLRM